MRIRIEKIKRLPSLPPWVFALIAAGVLILAVGVILYHRFLPPVHLCLLKNLTGLPCPACGLLRAAFALSRGEIGAAFLLNPFAFSAGIVLVLFTALRFGFGRALKFEAPRPVKALALAAVCLLFVGNWIYLILDGR